jgi:hypothetical protein
VTELTAPLVWDNNHWFCTSHLENLSVDWCEHIQRMIELGEDAYKYKLGDRLVKVPILPSAGIWATVVIDKEPVVANSAMMHMEYQPDIGNLRKIELGLWNPGEGMRSMRTVIVDWIKSRLDPEENVTSEPFKTRCPNNAHSLRSSRIMSEKANDPGWKWTCLWNIVMERACTPCLEESQGGSDVNFGVDDSVIPNKPWNPYA